MQAAMVFGRIYTYKAVKGLIKQWIIFRIIYYITMKNIIITANLYFVA